MTAFLTDLPFWTAAFTLVLARTGCAIMLLPGVGEADAPAITRVGIAVTITILLAPLVAPLIPPGIADFGDFARALAAEMLTGIWLGWLARVIVLALPMAGQVIAHMIGVSNVLQNEAGAGGANTALSQLFTLAVPVVLLTSGLYALPLDALVNSYQAIPPGHFLPVRVGTELAITTVTKAFSLSLQLASPFVVLSMVWFIAVGLTARLSSRLQIYFVAAPSQILGGIILLSLLATSLLSVWQHSTTALFSDLPGVR